MREVAGSSVPRHADHVLQAEVDGDLVLMSPKDFAYFGTQSVGAEIWEAIDGERSLDDIVTELESRYDAEPGMIRAQTLEYVDALVASGLATLD